jgi:hypothetical protein
MAEWIKIGGLVLIMCAAPIVQRQMAKQKVQMEAHRLLNGAPKNEAATLLKYAIGCIGISAIVGWLLFTHQLPTQFDEILSDVGVPSGCMGAYLLFLSLRARWPSR